MRNSGKKKKIAFVVSTFDYDGICRMTAQLAHEFINRGFEVEVIALTKKIDTTRHIFDSRVQLTVFSWPRILAFIPLWWHFIKNRNYIACISAVDFVNVFTILAHKFSLQKAKLICTVRTDLRHELKHNASLRLSAVIWLAKILYGHGNKIVAVSQGTAEGLRAALGRPELPVQVIYNPAAKDINRDTPIPKPHPWFHGNAPVLVSCGRLTTQKDFGFLISSFFEVLREQPARLLILGDGILREELQAKIDTLGISREVQLVGNVDHPEHYMYHARMFVMSSLWEGFGNVLVEALSAGCPVVAMDCESGPAEILGDGKWGRLVKERSVSLLSKGILEELASPRPPMEYLKSRAEDFHPRKIAEQYNKLSR